MNSPTCIKHRVDLIHLISGGRAVELGVAQGLFSEELLRASPFLRLASIDSWDDPARGHDDEEFKAACARLAPYGPRSIVMRKTFRDALDLFPNNSLDFVYVDGYAHTGQDSGRTLHSWWPKVKPGGVFAGHDYDSQWPLTVQEVDAFAAKWKLKLQFTMHDEFASWYVRK
jgi:predicted O-methyltransferase YrrM